MNKILRNSLIALLFVLIAVYGIVTYTYNSKFLPNTTLNGVAINGLTTDDANTTLAKNFQTKKYHLIEDDKTRFTLTGSQLGFNGDFKKTLTTAMADQNAFAWPIALFTKQKITAENITNMLNQKQLTATLNKLDINAGERTASKNASITKNDNSFQIKKESYGNIIDEKALEKTIISQVSDNNTTIKLDKLYIKPTLLSSDSKLTESLEKLSALKDKKIKLAISKNEVVIPQKVMLQALTVTNTGEPTTDETVLKNYVTSLSKKYDTNDTARSFKSTKKGEITTASTGTYGWSLNTSDTEKKISNAILAGKDTTIQPLHYGSGYGENDHSISGNYVEIDIAAQHMWFYQDNKLVVDTPVVTGNAKKNHDTPKGVFAVWKKERNATLVGEDYKQPVSYWLPIDWTGVGIHDANWRPKFGGDIYKTSGSHGCINTPPDVMKKIYETISEGTPVVVY